jgi:protocatechuate 3,4-dioxygenase beta subunit
VFVLTGSGGQVGPRARPTMDAMLDDGSLLSRRRLLRAGASLSAAIGAAALPLALTLERADADERPTPESIEGPYWKPGSPARSVLRAPDTKDTSLVLSGRVLSTRGEPVAKALVDVWQADGDGVYDLDGFRLRGHQWTSAEGAYRVETVVPGYYPGRTRHLHVKVQAPGARVLTTQLFFPNDPANRGDPLYSTWLRLRVVDVEGGKAATFDFVVPT